MILKEAYAQQVVIGYPAQYVILPTSINITHNINGMEYASLEKEAMSTYATAKSNLVEISIEGIWTHSWEDFINFYKKAIFIEQYIYWGQKKFVNTAITELSLSWAFGSWARISLRGMTRGIFDFSSGHQEFPLPPDNSPRGIYQSSGETTPIQFEINNTALEGYLTAFTISFSQTSQVYRQIYQETLWTYRYSVRGTINATLILEDWDGEDWKLSYDACTAQDILMGKIRDLASEDIDFIIRNITIAETPSSMVSVNVAGNILGFNPNS